MRLLACIMPAAHGDAASANVRRTAPAWRATMKNGDAHRIHGLQKSMRGAVLKNQKRMKDRQQSCRDDPRMNQLGAHQH